MSSIRIIRSSEEDPFAFLATRRVHVDIGTTEIVARIIERVRAYGDGALLEYAHKFDSLKVRSILVTEEEIDKAEVTETNLKAIRHSIARVRQFHDNQLAAIAKGWKQEGACFSWSRPEPHGGHIGQRMRPQSSVGVYVPAGKATYPSSVIMNIVPALCAGVQKVVITSPASSEGDLADSVLVAARECGVRQLAKIGGAAAIAALTFGTESVPRVDKICGPGNRFVNEAKRQLWGQVGLDLYAGPSEVCVLVDESSDARFAAADLLTQVEHAEDNEGFLVSTSEAKLGEVLRAVHEHLERAPRQEIMRKALSDFGVAILVRDLNEAVEIVNAIAPEHLTLAIRDAESTASRIQNAGCILLGDYTPESGGDFAMGPSHTLPTSTAARFASPLNVLDFLKLQSVSYLTQEDLAELVPTIEAFAEMEGFPAHGRDASIRFG